MRFRAALIALFFTTLGYADGLFESEPLPDLATAILFADSMVIYEGLPHPVFERESFQREKESKDVFARSGEHFYRKTLVLSDKDRKVLADLVRSTQIYSAYRGAKLCGGFHADYMIEWRRGDAHLVSVLLCFSCREALVHRLNTDHHAELTKAAYEALSPLLKSYRQERPYRETRR